MFHLYTAWIYVEISWCFEGLYKLNIGWNWVKSKLITIEPRLLTTVLRLWPIFLFCLKTFKSFLWVRIRVLTNVTNLFWSKTNFLTDSKNESNIVSFVLFLPDIEVIRITVNPQHLERPRARRKCWR